MRTSRVYELATPSTLDLGSQLHVRRVGPPYAAFHAVLTAAGGASVGAALALGAVQQAPVAATSANAMRSFAFIRSSSCGMPAVR